MSANFRISLPPWPMGRVISEACAEWNLRHPNRHADPEASEWVLVYAVVHAFCRHSLSWYEQALAEGGDRDQLHEQISRAACRQYTWLRVHIDPRKSLSIGQEQGMEKGRPFNNFSKELSELVSERSRLAMAIKEARRKRAEGWREYVARLERNLVDANARIETLNAFFRPYVVQEGEYVKVSSLICSRRVRRYEFGGREMPESYIKSTGFNCPACEMTVLRTKCAIAHGAGKKLVAFSCHCLSVAIEPPFAAEVDRVTWQARLSERNQNTNIVLQDKDVIFYGHARAKDIAEGRKDAKDITVYRDVDLDVFIAFLKTHFSNQECVRALPGRDAVTQDQLKRISTEIMLSTSDIAMIQEAQKSASGGSDAGTSS